MNNKTILIIDGQGGGLGKAIIERLAKANLPATLLAVGTNSMATAAMLKAGANEAATGENAVIHNAVYADFIVGPIGIISSNAMFGEISPEIASAVASSHAKKYLIPVNKCNLNIIGSSSSSLSEKIDNLTEHLRESLHETDN